MMKRFSLCLCVSLWYSSFVFAGLSFEEVLVEYWAGEGSNRGMIVVDFDDSCSYAFGYRWEGAKTSYDALLAIDAFSQDFSMNSHWDDSVGGWFIDDLNYLGATKRGSSWSFFTSTDGSAWSLSWVGASDRFLTDGAWDGWASGDWVWVGPGDWDWAFTGSVRTPVPEPATLGMLGLMGLLTFKKQR